MKVRNFIQRRKLELRARNYGVESNYKTINEKFSFKNLFIDAFLLLQLNAVLRVCF
jgi:hypothetical protein